MKRRNFLSLVSGSIAAALVPDLGPLDLSPVHASGAVDSRQPVGFENDLLDLLFENISNAPEFSAGTFHISLHTSEPDQ